MWLARSVTSERQGHAVPRAVRACTACHQDTHKGQFAAGPHKNRCEDCHDAAGWNPRSTPLAAHNQTTFALKGAQSRCRARAATRRAARIRLSSGGGQLHGLPQNPHGALDAAIRCESCHSVTSWKRARTASITARPHSRCWGVTPRWTCLACHKPVMEKRRARMPSTAQPRIAPAAMPTCHGGQFQAAGDEKGCARCHTVLELAAHRIRPQPPFDFQARRRARAGSVPDVPQPAPRGGWPFLPSFTREHPGSANNAISETRILAFAFCSRSPRAAAQQRTRNPHGPLPVSCEACHTATAWKPIRAAPGVQSQHADRLSSARHARRRGVPAMPYSIRSSRRPRTIALPVTRTCIARRWAIAASSATR